MSGKIVIKMKPKLVIKPKSSDTMEIKSNLIDLKVFNQMSKNKGKPNKDLILEVLNKLIEHTEINIQNSSGDEKKKHLFRIGTFKKAVAGISASNLELTSGSMAKQIPGIGKGMADRIDEILTTGTLTELRKTVVADVETELLKELTSVTGIGESNAKKFIELGVTGLNDLMDKVKTNEIKVTHHMQIGLQYYYDIQQKIPHDEIIELSNIMKHTIHEMYPELMIEICGSFRRKKAFSGDIDVLITHPLIKSEMDFIDCKVPYLINIVSALHKAQFLVGDLTTKGTTKYMGVCMHPTNKIGRRIDIRFIQYDGYYPALLYFTGSVLVNKLMRTIAIEKNMTLNEYGLFHCAGGIKGDRIILNSEQHAFEILGIKYLEPHERELV